MNRLHEIAAIALTSASLVGGAYAQDEDTPIYSVATTQPGVSTLILSHNINTKVSGVTGGNGIKLHPIEHLPRIYVSSTSVQNQSIDERHRALMDESRRAIGGIFSLNIPLAYQRITGERSRSDSIGIRLPEINLGVPTSPYLSYTRFRQDGNQIIPGYSDKRTMLTFSFSLGK